MLGLEMESWRTEGDNERQLGPRVSGQGKERSQSDEGCYSNSPNSGIHTGVRLGTNRKESRLLVYNRPETGIPGMRRGMSKERQAMEWGW